MTIRWQSFKTQVFFLLLCRGGAYRNSKSFLIPSILYHTHDSQFKTHKELKETNISFPCSLFSPSLSPGIINDILSARFWIPLSRMTYNVYLIHVLVVNFYFFNESNAVMYSDTSIVSLSLSLSFLSLSLSLSLSLVSLSRECVDSRQWHRTNVISFSRNLIISFSSGE